MSFYFSLYGLCVKSDIFFPELISQHADAHDVHIQYGDIPDHIPNPNVHTAHCQMSAEECVLSFDGVAKYHIIRGHTIIIEPYGNVNVDEAIIRFYTLGTVMGILLHQRKLLVLHASAVQLQKGAVVFIAPSGYGKSTLAAALYQHGLPIMADDLCVIDCRINQAPIVYPGYPRLKIWQDVVDKLKIDEQLLTPLPVYSDANALKYALSTRKHYVHQPQPLLHVYELDVKECEDVQMHSLYGSGKCHAIMKHTFRANLIPALALQASHFSLCTTLAKAVPVSKITRPAMHFQLEALLDILLDTFHEFSENP